MRLLERILQALGCHGPEREPVDIAPMLDALAAKSHQRSDWRHSVVDMLKLLEIDSGADNRKQLAEELGYSGSFENSAAMNEWLHREVMRRVAQNGGIVPEELR